MANSMNNEEQDVETGYSRRVGEYGVGDNRYRAPYHDEKGEIRIRGAKPGHKVRHQTYDPRPGGRLRAEWKNYDIDVEADPDNKYRSEPDPYPTYRDAGRTKQRLEAAGLRDIMGHSDYNEKALHTNSLLTGLEAAREAGATNTFYRYLEELEAAGVDTSHISVPGDDNTYTNFDGYAGDYREYSVEPIHSEKLPVAGEGLRGEGAVPAAIDAAQRQYDRPLSVQKQIAEDQRVYNEGVRAGTGNHPRNR